MDIPQIDVGELSARLDRGEGLLLDVRRRDEWDEVHIEGALLITLDELGDRLDELPPGDTVLVICRSGNRSAVATQALRGAGFDAVNVSGGMLAWVDSGRDAVSGAG